MSCCHAPRPGEIVRDVTVFFATTLYFTTQSSNRPRNLSYELPDRTSSLFGAKRLHAEVLKPRPNPAVFRGADFSLPQVVEELVEVLGQGSTSPFGADLEQIVDIPVPQVVVVLVEVFTVFSQDRNQQQIFQTLATSLAEKIRERNPAPCLIRQWIRVHASVPQWIWYLVYRGLGIRSCLMLYCSRSSGIQHHAWFDSGFVFLRQSHDKFGHPSFEMSRSFLNQVLAHFDLLRNWKVTKVYL